MRCLPALAAGGLAAVCVSGSRGFSIVAGSSCRTHCYAGVFLPSAVRRIMSHLDHPNVLKFLGVVLREDRRVKHLVLRRAHGGSLHSRLQSGWIPTLRDVVSIAVDILKGLHYLHAMKPCPVLVRCVACALPLSQSCMARACLPSGASCAHALGYA